MEKSNINVIIYCRVSTDEQAQKGFSLEYQEASLIRFCEGMGYNIIKTYKEDHSAKNFKRPQWSDLKSFVKGNKKSIDKVLFAKWDRFSRNTEQALAVIREFDNMGIEVNASEQYLDMTNSDNKMVLSIYLTAGEVERDKISSRTLNGTYQAKKEGYFTGKAPYGYSNFRDEFKKSTLKPNEYSHFVKKAFDEVAMNMEPVETIRKKLKLNGMELGKSAFCDLLKNITYTGKIYVPEFKKESAMIVEGKHDALVSMETFYKVQKIFKNKRWYGLKPSHKNLDFPLRDFLICEVCGRQITGSISQGRSKKYGYYHCRGKCETRVSVEVAHDNISNLLIGLQINGNIKKLFADVLKDSEAQINGNKAIQLKSKMERQQFLMKNLDKADDMRIANELPLERYKSIVERYNSELIAINTDIEILKTSDNNIKQYVDSSLEFMSNLNILFIESDYDGKRLMIGSLFTDKIIFGNKICRTTQMNEVINVLTRNSKGLEKMKNGQTAKNYNLTANVPGAGLEPARFPTGV